MANPDWTPLRNALRDCRAANTMPTLWWRDDDAVAPTRALDQLCALTETFHLSVHLAIIPALATDALAAYCVDAPLIPVVHGWAHTDHSAAHDKKNEFLTPRPDAKRDAARGLTHMRSLFGQTLRPMFVPPWNRISAQVTTALPDMGYTTLSTFGPRGAAVPGLTRINTHVDPIHWKGTRSLVDTQTLIDDAAAHLRQRSTGAADASEPFGLLTHHLVHDAAIWAFAETFLTEMLTGGATPWQMET
ncbi:polysaccharide deacetylase family protein [uncultured Tateyamaria sp.]|uniref:polysaccharide deacetylase family protein n=1 Tax=Tateyamaria sp. 1078 TaxID=3417464 RepID=UPI002619486A|nr:polysaccharide deacetylase family protein [uncultured Tateyamaria sp.]